jgi:hypothetical protein
MTVRVCDVTFSDWVSLPMEGKYTDTFIFRISSQACLPPFVYGPLLRRVVAKIRHKRPCASLWVQVDAPGQWLAVAIHHALRGLNLPFIVTQEGGTPTYARFSLPPVLSYSRLPDPPVIDLKLPNATEDELRCLQALGRMIKGQPDEIASLAGLPVDLTLDLLSSLERKVLVVHKISRKITRGKTRPEQFDIFPLWHTTPKGLSIALRSWGVPKGIEFTTRLEKNRAQIGYGHRHIARLWPAWLKAAWPHAEIWAGWSEVHIPGTFVIPDALAWGRMHGYETLFWLEVGDTHKSRKKINQITTNRLEKAMTLCKRTGMRLVYTQLSTKWVQEVVARACVVLSPEVAVVMGNRGMFGELPPVEWGKFSIHSR